MKTSFTLKQLESPEIRQAQKILGDCVHYGFCTNTCPTYVLTRDENDAPRGRIDLIHDMLEQGGTPQASTVHYLDRCLSCLTCVSSCAVKVDYMHLIDIAREYIEDNFKRPLKDRFARWVVSFVIPRPAVFKVSLQLSRMGRPFKKWLPTTLGRLIDLAPLSVPVARNQEPEASTALKKKRYRVAVLEGCAQRVLDADIHAATVRVLERHGCEVVAMKRQGCCGALTLHMGMGDQGKNWAKKAIDLWFEEGAQGLDAIVINASGCGTTVKDYAHLFADDPDYSERAKFVSQRAADVTEFLSRIGLEGITSLEYDVAYHDACSLKNGQRVIDQPRELLRSVGLVVHDTPEAHFCCGSAGTYNIFQPELADNLGARKAANIESTGAQFAAMGNIGCLTQIRRMTQLPLVHTVQLLDWATGGPQPAQLEGIKPRIHKVHTKEKEENAVW